MTIDDAHDRTTPREGRRLSELVKELPSDIAVVGHGPDPIVTDVTHDSRSVQPGALFCCLPGESTHGRQHAAAAVASGAVAILDDRLLDEVGETTAQLVVADPRRTMAHLSAVVHQRPSRSLEIVGITGTNGKTTTAAFVGSILDAAGRKTVTLGTLHGARTTPESSDLQRTLAASLKSGVRSVVMEVSSHALALHRVDATEFAVGVFTNLGHDHLDFHGTFEAYADAKARLFSDDLCRLAVINMDDPYGPYMAERSTVPVIEVHPSSARVHESTMATTRFSWSGLGLSVNIAGRHNMTNAILAAATGRALGVDDETIRSGIAAVAGVRGRFQLVQGEDGRLAVVDYAHTPEALENLLAIVREIVAGRIIVVFGCGGDRDRPKRPEMGRVAAAGADVVVITSDNPRSEEPSSIADQIISGIATSPDQPVRVELDRRTAIVDALASARPGDVVVVAGKGHETTQELADRVVAFDDVAVIEETLSSRHGGRG